MGEVANLGIDRTNAGAPVENALADEATIVDAEPEEDLRGR